MKEVAHYVVYTLPCGYPKKGGALGSCTYIPNLLTTKLEYNLTIRISSVAETRKQSGFQYLVTLIVKVLSEMHEKFNPKLNEDRYVIQSEWGE